MSLYFSTLRRWPVPVPTRSGPQAIPRMMSQDLALAIKRVDASTRRIAGVASCEAEDRMGDVVVASGIDTTEFMQNPVLLGDHDHHFILGRVDRLWLGHRREGPALLFEATVLPAGTSARVDERWAAIQGGAANATSIGFIGKEAEQRQTSDGRVGLRFTKSLLLELSSVAIPACAACLIEQRACGGHAAGACGCGGDLTLEVADWTGGVQRGVPANVSTARAPEDTPWRAPTLGDFTSRAWSDLSDAEKRRIAGHFAWCKTGAMPATFGDLALPHHRAGDGAVVWNGVRAAMARANQVTGGDVAAIMAHLRSHAAAFGKALTDLAADDEEIAVLDERTGRVVPLGRDALDQIVRGRLRGMVNGTVADAVARARRGR